MVVVCGLSIDGSWGDEHIDNCVHSRLRCQIVVSKFCAGNKAYPELLPESRHGRQLWIYCPLQHSSRENCPTEGQDWEVHCSQAPPLEIHIQYAGAGPGGGEQNEALFGLVAYYESPGFWGEGQSPIGPVVGDEKIIWGIEHWVSPTHPGGSYSRPRQDDEDRISMRPQQFCKFSTLNCWSSFRTTSENS